MQATNKFVITVRHDGLASFLDVDLVISAPDGKTHYSCKALWDTGATNSMISKNVAEILNLKPIAFATVIGFHGEDERPIHEVSFTIGKNLIVDWIEVLEATSLTYEHQALIGMDIISQLDFAITNVDAKTIHSIRFPSMKEIDFENEGEDGSQETAIPNKGLKPSHSMDLKLKNYACWKNPLPYAVPAYNKPHKKIVNFGTAWAAPS
jgi:hypothetical protein